MRREADPATAERFAKAALQTFARLAETPGIGSPFPTTVPRLEKMRKWRVEGFPRTLIFYHAIDNGIRITRVLHASQNWVAMIDAP